MKVDLSYHLRAMRSTNVAEYCKQHNLDFSITGKDYSELVNYLYRYKDIMDLLDDPKKPLVI